MAERMAGKVAEVTGAASGLGKAIALRFLREGAKVLGADINETRLKGVDAEAAQLGYADCFRSVICNVTKTEDCENAIKACVDAFGTCNVLSNNAGIVDDMHLVAEIDDAVWDRVVAVNMTGTLKICRAALRYFVPNEIRGTIVLTTSDAIVQASTGGAPYVAAKNGAQGLVKSIAFEYGRKGIRINSFGPGGFASNISESVTGGWNREGAMVHMVTGYNAHKEEWAYKSMGDVEDLANVTLFLASDESDYVQGSFILANGGISL